MFARIKNDNGQAMVEFAIIGPLFIALMFLIIDFGWITYRYISFDYSYRQAAWETSINYDKDENEEISGDTARNAIINTMLTYSPSVRAYDLTVKNAKFKCWTETVPYYTPNLSGGTTKHDRKWRYVDITAKLSYNIQPITPFGRAVFGEKLTFSKNLHKHRLLRTKT